MSLRFNTEILDPSIQLVNHVFNIIIIKVV